MPSIMLAWFCASDRMTQPGSRLPSVESAAQFAT